MLLGKVNKLSDPKEKDKILDVYSEESILKSYVDIESIPCLIKSPLREDNKPSFSFFFVNGNLMFKDFSTGESGNLWTFLTKLTNKSYSELYQDILTRKPKKVELKETIKPTIEVVARSFNNDDIKYWESYGISLSTLKKGNVHPISTIILNREGSKVFYPADKYSYVYVEFENDKQILKIYQPYSKMKWLSNFNHSTVDLYSILPSTGDNIIITSSRKDAMTIMENCNIPSICFSSETVLPEYKIMVDLQKRFKNIYVLYDNDFDKKVNVGSMSADVLISHYSWIKKLTIPSEYKAKDPSDLVLKYNKQTLNNLISQQL